MTPVGNGTTNPKTPLLASDLIHSSKPLESTATQTGTGTILLVEDDEDQMLFIQDLMRSLRILNPVQAVPDGQAAMAYLSGDGMYANRALHPFPVLLLLDLNMPNVSGMDLLRWLEIRPRFHVPCVVLTAVPDQNEWDRAQGLGARTVLHKPLDAQEFFRTLKGIEGIEIAGPR